MLGAFLFCI